MNSTRTSERPDEPGRSFLHVVVAGALDPIDERTPKCRTVLRQLVNCRRDLVVTVVIHVEEPPFYLFEQSDVPRHAYSIDSDH